MSTKCGFIKGKEVELQACGQNGVKWGKLLVEKGKMDVDNHVENVDNYL